MSELPPRLARHFEDGLDFDDPRARGAAIARLLEDGDRADLAWLARICDIQDLVAWFDLHAARRLTRRSRALWAAALGREAPAAPALSETLWPLS